MNPIYIDTKHQVFWLSYAYLRKHGVSEDTYSQWSKRKLCKSQTIDGRAYINYDTIPEPTRMKLPTKEQIKEEYRLQKYAKYVQYCEEELKEAYRSERSINFLNEMRKDEKYNCLKQNKKLLFARRAAVIEWAMEYNYQTGILEPLFIAYNKLYPGSFSAKNRFSMMLCKAREAGVLSVAVDERSLRKIQPRFKDDYTGIAYQILKDPRHFTLPNAYEKFQIVCSDLNLKTPSFWWFRKYYRKERNNLEISRAGKSRYEKEHGLYAKIIPAKNRNSQWQIDGWEIPIYAKRPNGKGGFELWFKYVLVAVLDAHSRKMIGYNIAESENTTSILAAIEQAVKNTGVAPYEIVSDNHSFHKTGEADGFKEALEAMGVHWTVDSNPRRKAILERAFRTLGEKHLYDHYGYIGQGVKSKMKGGRMSQEVIDEYTKNQSRFVTFEQLALSVNSAIWDYNAKKKPSLKESPNERYARSEEPGATPVDEFKRAELFYKCTDQKVVHGQISFRRGMNLYEYQLPSEFSVKYESKTVKIYYADFDVIYLIDSETGEPICSVEQKTEIHGAKFDQSETDTENLYKNSGRTKGNNSKNKKRNTSSLRALDTVNPNAIESLNKVLTPKDTLKELEQDNELRRRAVEQGINPGKVTKEPELGILKITLSEEVVNRHPFAVKGEVEPGTIIIDGWK